MIVLFDAFTPTTISAPRPDAQKTMNLAFNFLELGPAALSVDRTCMPPVSVRSQHVDNAVGGWSACLAMYLRWQLLGEHNIARIGVPVCVNGEWATSYASLKFLGPDGEGIQDALDFNAGGGIVPCVRCMHVLTHPT